jgi:hypothetical protein
MNPKVIARVLLVVGFLAASVGYSSWTATRTVLDPSATRSATKALLAAPAVQTMLTREIRASLQPALGTAATNPKLNTAIREAVADPRFASAFENAITTLHREILNGGNGQVTLDTAAVTNAINSAVGRVAPALAPKVADAPAVRVPIGNAQVPHLGDIGRSAHRLADTAIALAIVLIAGALVLAPDRKMFRRAGRRTAFLAIPPAVIFVIAPHLLASSHNSALVVSAAVLEAFGRRVTLSIAVLVVVGVSTWLITHAVPARHRPPAPSEVRSLPTRRPAPPDPRQPSDSATDSVPANLYL